MDDETLLRQRPYQLVYSGELLAEQPLTPDKMKQIENGNMQQIFDLTIITFHTIHLR